MVTGWGAALQKFITSEPIRRHLWSCAKVIVGINTVGFGLTALTQTHKLTDLLGTGAFVAVTWYSHVKCSSGMGLRILQPTSSLLLTSCVTLWGTRLAGYLFFRILQTGHDSRLAAFFPEENEPWLVGRSMYPLKLAFFWGVQSLWPMIVLLPVFVSQKLTPGNPITRLHMVPFGGFLFGFIWETVADIQKFIFKSKPKNKDLWIQKGLYRYSRHPNYFGEIVVWASMCALASNRTVMRRAPWVVISPLFVYMLLRYVSGVPILEASHAERYGGDLDYLQYRERTNLLFPWRPKKIHY